MFRLDRSSGVLLHVTSLPSPDGIGDLGAAAYRFVDWLVAAGQRFWQVLPLNPAGPADSPYASPSAFAMNPLFISLQQLVDQHLLPAINDGQRPPFDERHVDYNAVTRFKISQFREAFTRIEAGDNPEMAKYVKSFSAAQASWLDDYALFMALKDEHGGQNWQTWQLPLRLREPAAIEDAKLRLATGISYHRFCQAVVFDQWQHLKRYANDRHVQVIGDIPIFVALDSVDVWANQDYFRLDQHALPVVGSGVPPDLFTADGQLWGNPVFDWNHHRAMSFDWWIARVRATLETVDLIRIDHFRGFAAAWVIPADAETARPGHWERGPGGELFAAIIGALGDVPMIAEDLGLITPDVDRLRLDLNLPGMKVLQFGFGGGAENVYLPHNFERRTVVYTGTHDNQTTIGWFLSQPETTRLHVQTYLGRDGSDVAWDFIRLALASVADLAIVPLQDVLRLDDTARMNAPGSQSGNWQWRFTGEQLESGLASGMTELTAVYGRTAAKLAPRHYDPYDYFAPGTEHPLFDEYYDGSGHSPIAPGSMGSA